MADGKDPTFSMVWTTVVQAAGSARLSGAEVLVLVALMRYQGIRGNHLSVPASRIAHETGLSIQTVWKAEKALCEKRYRNPSGCWVPILLREKEGRAGQTATYLLNVPKEW